jgi:hypothetical protein
MAVEVGISLIPQLMDLLPRKDPGMLLKTLDHCESDVFVRTKSTVLLSPLFAIDGTPKDYYYLHILIFVTHERHKINEKCNEQNWRFSQQSCILGCDAV